MLLCCRFPVCGHEGHDGLHILQLAFHLQVGSSGHSAAKDAALLQACDLSLHAAVLGQQRYRQMLAKGWKKV